LNRGEGIALLSVPVAGWMAYLIQASARFGKCWPVSDPYADKVADSRRDRLTQKRWPPGSCHRHHFRPRPCRNDRSRMAVISVLDGLSDDPMISGVVCKS
jgi:fructuronate reductase